MKFFKKFAAVLIAMAVFTVGNIDILPRDAVEDFMLSVRAEDSDIVDSGECGDQGDNLTWTLDSEGTLTISGEGEMEDYIYISDIPWFVNKGSITRVIIEEYVTTIGRAAFYECYGLTSITIPDSVTSIGEYAFWFCDDLTSITIPDSVTSIGEFTFACCKNLTSITIPDSVKSIERCAFTCCENLTSIIIPDRVISIGNSAFNDCYSLTSIKIPDSIKIISTRAFENCNNLNSIIIPDSVTSIGDYAFMGCDSLTDVYYSGSEVEWNSITIGSENERLYDSDVTIHYNYNSSETEIIDSGTCGAEGDNLTWTLDNEGTLTISGRGKMADFESQIDVPWHSYSSIATVIIDNGITSIEDFAFISQMSLTSITIPDSVVIIGDYAFWACDSLTSIVIPDSVTHIGDCAFATCINLTSINVDSENKYYTSKDGVLFNKDKSILIQYPSGKTAKEYDISDSVASIGDLAFYACDRLITIAIPDSVTNIGDSAFAFCDNLTYINVDSENKYYVSEDGVLFNKDKSILIKYPEGKTTKEYDIPDGVINIRDQAFCSCYSLLSISIPESVTNIGDSAFGLCFSLTSITIPDSVTSIGNSAFSSCSSLTSITIPDSVTSIGNSAFSFCSSLTSITIPDSVISIGYYAFDMCESLKDVYYDGNEEEWNTIVVRSGNECLTNATIHYNFKLPDSEKQSVYQFFNMPLSWERAKEYCESLNGHLAVISSAEEQAIIEAQIPNISKNCYWIGAYLENDEWKWVTDEPFDYENWGENLPDNNLALENYAHMYGKEWTGGAGTKYKGEWNDVSGVGADYANDFYAKDNFGFICEWEDGDRELTGVIDFDVMQVAEFIANNPNYYLTSDTVELISQSKEVALLDPSVTSYLGWKDFENFISGDTTVDKYNAKLTIQTMVADLLLSDDVAHSVNDVSELASENAMNESLMLFKENAEKLNITGERLNNLENILSLGSSSIDAAKRNKWIAEFLGDVKPDLLSDTLGIASDTANMFGIIYSIKQDELSNSEDLYKLYIASIAYASANDALKESLALLKQYIDIEAEKYNSGTDVYSKRVRYVAEEFSNYYQIFIDTTGASQREYAEELALQMAEHTASQLAVFGIEKIIEAGLTIACPELHIVLEMLGAGFKIGMNVWESLSDVDEQALERDMFLNTLVFSDAIGNAMNDVQYGFPALVFIRLDKYSTEMYQYGIRFYQKINKMMLEHAHKHQLMLAIEMPDKNWFNTDDVDMILMCNAMFGTSYVEETLDIRGIVDIAEKIRYYTIDSLNDYEYQQFESVAPWDVERMVNDFYTQSFYVNHGEFYKLENEIKYHPLLIMHVIETGINAIYAIHCPVDITITKNGTIIAEVKNEILTMIDETSDIPINLIRTAENESASKYVMLPEGYELQITGNGMGTMSFEKAIIENGSVIEISNIEEIPVTVGSVYNEVIEGNKTIALECDLDNDGVIDKILNVKNNEPDVTDTSTSTTTASTVTSSIIATTTTTINDDTQLQVSEELLDNIIKILDENGTTSEDIYKFVKNNNTYKVIEETRSLEEIESIGWVYFANYALNNEYVVQYYFAAITELLFQYAGYESRIVYGTGRGSGEHYWNQILVNNQWINYDTCNGYCAVSDEYLKNQNYTIEEYIYPRFIFTTYPSYLLGDVNEDGSVDSSDASLVLAEYAKIQTGGVGEFTDIQYKAADVNKDNVVDSSDASKILAYYAMISTGKAPTWD